MAPTGTIYGTDRRGNYKVRSPELQKPVVLSGSNRVEDLDRGDKVEFKVTSHGDHVDFSGRGNYTKADGGNATGPARTEPQKKADDSERSIDIVLLDVETGDVLVVGTWSNPDFVPYTDKGNICGRNYALTDSQRMERHTAESLAEKLGIDPTIIHSSRYEGVYRISALQFVWAVSGHPDREIVEESINSRL